jgi:hypothetical protein
VFFDKANRVTSVLDANPRCVVKANGETSIGRMTSRRLGVIWSSDKAYTVDALAVRGDEGRGSLRKVSGSWQQALIRQCPNGETHLLGGTVH